ncbi:MAG: MFS transporter [Faecalibacterium sp.]|jgi:fucose permease|nr:MFS transporter [Faecalibacterium sp.]
MKKPNYQNTIAACFTGCVVQAIVNNFAPLLFLTFQKSYGISLARITALVTVNFGVQLAVDMASALFVDRIGYRTAMLLAHGMSTGGLLLLTVLPGLTADPFIGLLAAVIIYAMGGGLLEVLVSPIMEACPTKNKEKAMSLLHSFYCWGHVAVVVLSTLFFTMFGIENWKILARLWAIVPLLNFLAFTRVPLAPILPEGERGLTIGQLAQKKVFWLLALLMLCAGASEQAVSQWASVLAEKGLGVTKTIGDLAGPMFFALMMGLSRMFYGKYGDRIDLRRFMAASGALCAASYLVIALAPWPAVSLLGCGLCGLSVGILWPGTFSIACVSLRGGGTAMFALFALAGDIGCGSGPLLVGTVSGFFDDSLKAGILAALIFPAALLAGLVLLRRGRKA